MTRSRLRPLHCRRAATAQERRDQRLGALVRKGQDRSASRVYTNEEKLAHAQAYRSDNQASGTSIREYARAHDIGYSTFQAWIGPTEALQKRIEEKNVHSAAFKSQGAKFPEMEIRLDKWIRDRNDANLITPVSMITAEARRLQPEGFNASPGWFSNFKQRHGFCSTKLWGHRAASDLSAAAAFVTQEAPTIRAELHISPSREFNFDETILYYLQIRTFGVVPVQSVRRARGGRDSSKRAGLGVCINRDDSIRLPMMLCHKDVGLLNTHVPNEDQTSIQLSRQWSPYGWVTSANFVQYLFETFAPTVAKMCKTIGEDKRVLLWLDNCASHKYIALHLWGVTQERWDSTKQRSEYKDWVRQGRDFVLPTAHGDLTVCIRWLPKNTTAVIQPCDQGVIAALKRRFKSKLVAVSGGDPSKLRNISFAQVATHLADIWASISSATVVNSWKPIMATAVDFLNSVRHTMRVNVQVRRKLDGLYGSLR